MKPSFRSAVSILPLAIALTGHAGAQTLTKASNTDNLNLASSWGGTLPGTGNTLLWNNTLAAANTSSLGGSLSVLGLQVTNPGGLITIGASTGATLTIGSGGIDLSQATQNLTINANMAIGANQTWTVAGGRTLAGIAGSTTSVGTGTGNLVMSRSAVAGFDTGTATIIFNQNGNGSGWSGYSGDITVNANVKVQSQGQNNASFGSGAITLAGGTIAQRDGSWAWSNNIEVASASVIGTDSSNGLGRTLKLLGNLTSANNSGLTFTSSTTGGTRNDDVGFILAGASASTYGTTTISANSRVRIGGNEINSMQGTNPSHAGNRGSLGTGDVTLSATSSELAFTRTDAHTVGNKITGTGTVVIGGNTTAMAGTSTQVVTLSGASTYTGATRVSRSRFNLTGSLTSAVTVDNSGSISGTGGTTGLLTLASGSNIALAGGGTTTSVTTNGVNFQGVNNVIFLATPVESTVYDVLTYGSGTVTNPGNLTAPYRGTLLNDTTNKKFTFTAGAYAATRTWNSTSGTWAVNSGTNFDEDDQKFFAADHVIFGNIASDATVTLSGTILPGSVTVGNAANTYTFAGAAIGGAASLSKSGAGTLLLSAANTFTGGTTVSGGTVKLGNAGALGAGTVTVGSGGTLDVAGFTPANAISLSGTGNGSNPALWNSAATFTTLSGAITLQADAAVGNSTTDRSLLFTLGSLNLNGNKLGIAAGAVSIAIQNLPSGNIEINNGGTLYSENGGSLTSVNGTITINSGGRMETRDTNNTSMTAVHNIVLNGGTLATATIANNNGGGGGTTLKNNISVDVTNGGTINGNNTGFGQNLRLTGELSGSGALTLTGAQGVELRGEAVNYTGTATVTNGTLFFNPTTSQSFGGVIAGSRPVIKEGTGTTTLLGANTYTGVTTIRGNNGTSGELRVSSINNGGVAGNLGQATSAAGNLVFGATGSTTGKLVYTGSGESTDRLFTLNGNAIIENNGSGALNFTGTGDLGKTSGILQTLTLGGTHGGSLAANIIKGAAAGSNLALIKNGTGTWSLSGTNTYTGDTTVNGGILELGGGDAIANSGDVILANTAGATVRLLQNEHIGTLSGGGATGGAVDLNGYHLRVGESSNATFAGSIAGGTSSKLIKHGTGSLVLSGVNTFQGTVDIEAGTVELGGGSALANTTDVILSNVAGASLKLNASEHIGSLSGGGATGGNVELQGFTLTVGEITDQTFGGAISGDGASALIKHGGGRLTLTGNNTFSGATTVSAGTLYVTGSLSNSGVTVNDNATLGGGGMVGPLDFAGGAWFDIFEAVFQADPLASTTISFSTAGFGIDNLVDQGAAVNWSSIANGTYTLITGALDSSNLDNLGLANAHDIGGGRSAYFKDGSLQLVVIPEPRAALLGGLGLLMLLRRRRQA